MLHRTNDTMRRFSWHCALLSILISMSGCTAQQTDVETSQAVNEIITTDEAVVYDDMAPELSIGDIDFTVKSMIFEYNKTALMMPFSLELLADDGWILSESLTYRNDENKQNDEAEVAIYMNSDYTESSCSVSSYNVSSVSGVSGSQRALQNYGVYSFTMHIDKESEKKPDINICGVSLFESDAQVMYNAIMDSKIDESSISQNGDISTYFFGYRFDEGFVELNITYDSNVPVGFSVKLIA